MLALLFFRGGGGSAVLPQVPGSAIPQGGTTGSATGKRRRQRIAGAKATHFSLDTGTVYDQRAFGKATSESQIQNEPALLAAERAEEAEALEALTIFIEFLE